jgi:alpha-beta hydrolase superfamily lysophospholipase
VSIVLSNKGCTLVLGPENRAGPVRPSCVLVRSGTRPAACVMEGELDPSGHFRKSKFKTSNGFELATYTWLPDCGVDAAKGCLFIFHGHRYHATFEFLEPNDGNYRTEYAGSIPARLNQLGLIVFAHDHPGHGHSTGERSYWNRMDEPVVAALEFCTATVTDEKFSLMGKPKLVLGMSAGGLVATQLVRRAPELFTGYTLLSPAVRPPDDMFGPFFRLLAAISALLDAAVPRLPVLELRQSDDLAIRDAVEKDGLVYKKMVHVRTAKEFQRAMNDITENADSIKFPALLVIIGLKDVIASPTGIAETMERVQCADKEVRIFENLGHEVIRESGCTEAREAIFGWIAKHM